MNYFSLSFVLVFPQVLTKTGDAPGGSIVLITDGKENEGPYLKDLRPALMKQGKTACRFLFSF